MERTHPKQINYTTPPKGRKKEEERTEPRVSHRGKGTEIVTVNILVYTDPVTNYTSSAQARPLNCQSRVRQKLVVPMDARLATDVLWERESPCLQLCETTRLH